MTKKSEFSVLVINLMFIHWLPIPLEIFSNLRYCKFFGVFFKNLRDVGKFLTRQLSFWSCITRTIHIIYLFWFNFQICSCSIGCGLQCIYYLVINCKLFFTTFYYGQLRHFLWQSHNSLLSNFKFQREHKSMSTFHQVLYQEELLYTYVCIIYIIHFHTKICFCNV